MGYSDSRSSATSTKSYRLSLPRNDGGRRLRSQNERRDFRTFNAAIRTPPQNQTLARWSPVAPGKYTLPLPYVIARKMRGPQWRQRPPAGSDRRRYHGSALRRGPPHAPALRRRHRLAAQHQCPAHWLGLDRLFQHAAAHALLRRVSRPAGPRALNAAHRAGRVDTRPLSPRHLEERRPHHQGMLYLPPQASPDPRSRSSSNVHGGPTGHS